MFVIAYNVVMVRKIFSLRSSSKGQGSAEVHKAEEKELEWDCELEERYKIKKLLFYRPSALRDGVEAQPCSTIRHCGVVRAW